MLSLPFSGLKGRGAGEVTGTRDFVTLCLRVTGTIQCLAGYIISGRGRYGIVIGSGVGQVLVLSL